MKLLAFYILFSTFSFKAHSNSHLKESLTQAKDEILRKFNVYEQLNFPTFLDRKAKDYLDNNYKDFIEDINDSKLRIINGQISDKRKCFVTDPLKKSSIYIQLDFCSKLSKFSLLKKELFFQYLIHFGVTSTTFKHNIFEAFIKAYATNYDASFRGLLINQNSSAKFPITLSAKSTLKVDVFGGDVNNGICRGFYFEGHSGEQIFELFSPIVKILNHNGKVITGVYSYCGQHRDDRQGRYDLSIDLPKGDYFVYIRGQNAGMLGQNYSYLLDYQIDVSISTIP